MAHKDIFRKILFCTDFNSDAMAAFHYALNIAEGNRGSEIVIFHAVPEPEAQFWKTYIYEVDDVDTKAIHDIDRKVAELYRPAIPEDMNWSSRFAVGNVGEEILKAAREESADLIVIGRGAGSNMINRMLGNYTEKVIRKSRCPVLVVPEEEKD